MGSNRYYAARYVRFRQRKAIFALYAFDNAVFSIPFLVSEPDVARAKLQWWRDAIHEMFQTRKSPHPVLHCLIPYLDTPGWHEDLFIKYIDNTEHWLNFDVFQTTMEFLQHSARTSAILAKLTLFLFVEPSEKTSTFASHFAIVMDIAHFIEKLGSYTKYNKLPFSHELLNRLHIQDHELFSPISSSHFIHLLKDQIPFVQAHIKATEKLYTGKTYRKLRYFRVMIRLAMAQLENHYEKTANTSEVKEGRDLMPFVKLWLAFRTH